MTILLTLGFVVPIAPATAAPPAFDQALIDLVNDWRVDRGLRPLVEHRPMSDRAQGWSDYMAGGSAACASAGSRWGHSSLSLTDPANPSGTTAIAENIGYSCGVEGRDFDKVWSSAAGPLPGYCDSSMDYTSPEMIVCGWLSSPGHRSAIANPAFTHIASGTATVVLDHGVERFATHQFTTSTATQPPPAPDESGNYDVSCDGIVDIVDAMLIAQYEVGLRTDAGSCSMTDPATQLHAARGDLDGNGIVNVVDALIIARCVVGVGGTGCS